MVHCFSVILHHQTLPTAVQNGVLGIIYVGIFPVLQRGH